MFKLITGIVVVIALILMMIADSVEQSVTWGVLALLNHITLVWMCLEDKIKGKR